MSFRFEKLYADLVTADGTVCVAYLALLADPPLLLLDEPYNGFDVETYHCFLDWSDEAKRAGKCIIVVTHIAFDRERFDRILTLRDGVLTEGAQP